MADKRLYGDRPVAVDPFFEVIHDGQWNACVGIQGDEQNYIDGYIEAALELVTAVMEKELIGSRDTLAMPILFSGRHALELSMKFAIRRLHRMGVVPKLERVDHDIQSHWTHLRDAKVGDAMLRRLIDELEPFVRSLAKIDDDGQELRYAKNRDGEKSLGGIAVVNLPHIRASLETMSGILATMKNRVVDIEQERLTGTHTRDCSRRDLCEIANMLGAHATWTEDSFLERKEAVRKKFGLSSGRFSDAVDKIRGSRELAALVGIETPLIYLSDEKALLALGLWTKAHPVRERKAGDLGIDYFNRDFEEFEEHRRVAWELDEAILNTLTVEEFSDLEVLFYFGRNPEFGEHYETMLTETVAAHRAAGSRWEGVHHIMSKTSLLDSVVKGSSAAGRPTLASKLRSLRASPAAALA